MPTRLWWLRQQDSSHDQYHINCGWRFAAELKREALLAALGGLVQRHGGCDREGHVVRSAIGEGGHTYAAWESMLPDAIRWSLDDQP